MKSADLKIIAIILAVALVFTVIASNAVSVASIVFLAKNDIAEAPAAQQQTQQQAQPQQQQQQQAQQSQQSQQQQSQQTVETTAPAANNGSSTVETTAPAGNSGNTTPDANKPADNNGGSTAAKKTDKEVLEIYTTLMNKAKKDKPGYKKVEYQELPGDAANRQISKGANFVDTLLNLVTNTLDLLTTKEEAEASPEIVEKGGDMRWFPVYKCEKGCYLTDVSAIESTKYEDLGNGKARITIELKDEQNPEPMAEGASTSPSKTGAMFSPLSKADIDNTINGGVVQAVIKEVTYNLTYHDCKAVVEYDTKTNEIIKLEQYMNVAIQGGGKIFGVSEIKIDKQELFNTMIITDFKY